MNHTPDEPEEKEDADFIKWTIGRAAPKIMVAIKNGTDYITDLADKTEFCPSHVHAVVDSLEENNYLTRKRDGRKKTLSLTSVGKKAARHLEKLFNLVDIETAGSWKDHKF